MFWNRKQAIEDQRAAVVVDRLIRSEIGQKLVAEIAEDQRSERQQLIATIGETRAAIDRDGPGLAKALQDADRELERIEQTAAAVRAKRTMAHNAVTSFSARTDRAIMKAQAKLRATADPRIEELEREIEERWNVFRRRRGFEQPSGTEPDPYANGPDQKRKAFVSFADSLGEQLRILESLRDECRALAVQHAGDPAEPIASIRRRMPDPEMSLRAERYTVQRPRTVTVTR